MQCGAQVRRYPWGKCEALSSDHSDVAALKKLLLETGFEEFKAKTEERYYHYREEELLNLHDDDGRGWGPVSRSCSLTALCSAQCGCSASTFQSHQRSVCYQHAEHSSSVGHMMSTS